MFITLLFSCSEEYRIPEMPEETAKNLPSDWMYNQRAYPYESINQDVYKEAYKMTLDARENAQNRDMNEWELAGPVNIGGRVTDLALHPTDQNIIYVGTSEGGMFKTSDGGNTWTEVFVNIGSNSIGNLALAPSAPDIIYVGTGEANGSATSGGFFGDGVYKSIDGGNTWEYKGLENSNHIGRIVVDPTDPDRAFVAVAGVLYGKNDERGLYRTLDGGDTWENVLFLNDSTGCIDVVINPDDPDVLYAATWERIRRPWQRSYGGPSSKVFRSIDGGETWEALSNGLPPSNSNTGRIGLTISPSETNVVFAVYTTNPITNFFDGIYRSDDAGNNWYKLNDNDIENVFSSFGWFFGNLRVSPINSDDIWIMGVPLFRSFDNGENWMPMLNGMHVDQHALEMHPQNPDFVVAGNDGGVYLSDNGGEVWDHVQTLPINQFYNCEIDYLQPERIYGGTQDNGTLRTLTGNIDDWERILGGDGFQVIVDPTDNTYVYAEFQFGNLYRSDDGGETMNFIFNGGYDDRTNWNTPIAYDPSNPATIFYGANRLYRSPDRGDNWEPISDDLTDGQHPSGSQSFGTITTIAVAEDEGNTIYIGTDDGNVQVTFNGGDDWENISDGLPDRYVTSVAVSTNDPLTAYVTLSGYRYVDYQPHILTTTDGGENWTDISGNLPEIPLNDVIVDASYPNLIYVASDMGVWYTLDGGGNWDLLGSNFPMSVVNDLDLHPDEQFLIAATFGRSILKYDVSELIPNSTASAPSQKSGLKVFPNPLSETSNVVFENPTAGEVLIQLHNLNGQVVETIAKQFFPEGENQLNWNTQALPAGQYFIRMKTETGIYSAKVSKAR